MAWFLQRPLLFLSCRITFNYIIIFYFWVSPNALDPQAIEIRPYFLRTACYKSGAYLGPIELISFLWESNHTPQGSLSYQSANQFMALITLTKDKRTLAFHFLPAVWEEGNLRGQRSFECFILKNLFKFTRGLNSIRSPAEEWSACFA